MQRQMRKMNSYYYNKEVVFYVMKHKLPKKGG